MIIRLLKQHGPYAPGSEHEVVDIVPHGGYTDSEKQYVLAGDVYVPSDNAVEITETTELSLYLVFPCNHGEHITEHAVRAVSALSALECVLGRYIGQYADGEAYVTSAAVDWIADTGGAGDLPTVRVLYCEKGQLPWPVPPDQWKSLRATR